MDVEMPTIEPTELLRRLRRDINRTVEAFIAFETAEDSLPADSPIIEEARGDLTSYFMALKWHISQIDGVIGPETAKVA